MWSLANKCVKYFNTKKIIYVCYFAVRNHSERIRMMEKWCLLHFSSVCTAQKWALPCLPKGARFGRYRNISSESIVPDYTLFCLVHCTKPTARSQFPEIWANCSHPNTFLVHFLGQKTSQTSFLEFTTSFYVNKIILYSHSPFPPFCL